MSHRPSPTPSDPSPPAEPARATTLIVDDEELIRWSLAKRMQADGHTTHVAERGEDAIALFASLPVDLVLLDYRLPDVNGLEVLRRMHEIDADVPVILLTAFSTVRRAVDAMQLGAFHFLQKPFDVDEIAAVALRALETTRLRREVRRWRERSHDAATKAIIGDSPGIRELRRVLAKFAGCGDSTVLITGESGTGKNLVAKAIHLGSARASGPFMNITCSALAESLLESELFGHERGAFTDARSLKKGLLESADGGTVFLDEIGEMTPALQAKMLRFLEERAFRRVGGTSDIRPDVRVVAATHRDLEVMVAEGRFRQDLYYRLSVLHAHVPALRDRGDDVHLLAAHFIDRFEGAHDGPRRMTPQARALLESHPWPGNVRELRNAIERAVLLSDGDTLTEADFQQLAQRTTSEAPDELTLPRRGIDLRDLERRLLEQALRRTGGSRTGAGRLLGLNRDQVRYRIEKYGLEPYDADDA